MNSKVIPKIKTAPKSPGVYIFYKGSRPLYVGKAVNLKNRLASYLKEAEDSKIAFLQKEADRLVWRRLSSGIQALIVESQLIKKLRPLYNVMMKDDKSYFYVFISKDKFPQIFIGHSIGNWKLKIGNFERIGPFTDGRSLKIVIRALRRIFPYCTCGFPHRRFCLNSQIGNCPGFCCQILSKPPNQEQIKQYGANIALLKNFLLSGKISGKFQKELERLAAEKLAAFENISSHRQFLSSSPDENLSSGDEERFERAEAYDISHLSGKEAAGAMTAWVKKNGVWEADKSGWRKFKIKSAPKSDDPAAIAEIIGRRFNHPEWPFPDLVLIDGGLAQLNAAKKSMNNLNPKIISFAKPHKLVYGWRASEPLKISQLPEELAKFIQKAIYYTHNFAVRYHRGLRRQTFKGGF